MIRRPGSPRRSRGCLSVARGSPTTGALAAGTLLFATLILPTAACSSDPRRGYSFNSASSFNAASVSIAIFDNQTYDHGVESELTEAIAKEIQRTTRMAVVAAGKAADTSLSGIIRKSEMRTISRDSITGLANHTALTLTIDFEWRDNRTGQTLVGRRNFAAADTFVPARGTGELREAAVHGAVQQLARDIVAEMRGNW